MKTVDPEILSAARKMRGYNQTEASTLLGISQSKLSKMEKGDLSIDEDTVKMVSSVYDFPISFFYDDNDYSPDGHMYFRRKLTIPVKDIDNLLAKIKVLKIIFNKILESVDMPEFTLGEYDLKLDTPEEIADKVRFKMGIYKGRVPSLSNLLETNGIIVFEFDFDTDKIDGLSSITSKGYKIIFINKRMPDDRKRFSKAHELGHLLMHITKTPKFPETVEDEADRFASQFLMPSHEIIQDLGYLSFPKLAELKRKWQVSMRALIRRAYDLNVIDKQQYRNWQINFSKRNYNKQEPIPVPIERSTIIQDVLELFKRDLGYDESDLLNLTNLNRFDYESFFVNRRFQLFA